MFTAQLTPKTFKRLVSLVVLTTFIFSSTVPTPVLAQGMNLPVPGTMLEPSMAKFMPAMVTGIKIDPNNPLRFNFLIDAGQKRLDRSEKEVEYKELIKYFLAALTVPEADMWVNLSPYEQNRIIASNFGQTEMGRDMLAQDYILKQLAASLAYPEKATGRTFWQRIHQAMSQNGNKQNNTAGSFNKIWIVPETATVYENGNVAMVVESHLKVMIEEDYLALDKAGNAVKMGLSKGQNPTALSRAMSTVMREVIIPQIEREVNTGEHFAQLRQMYNSMILASWFKQRLKKHVLSTVYANQSKTKGVNLEDPKENEKIFEQYVQAFRKGVFNYIKEDNDPTTGQMIPRKYFSGGFEVPTNPDGAMAVLRTTNSSVDLNRAMTVNSNPDEVAVELLKEEVKTTIRLGQGISREDWNKAIDVILSKYPQGVSREVLESYRRDSFYALNSMSSAEDIQRHLEGLMGLDLNGIDNERITQASASQGTFYKDIKSVKDIKDELARLINSIFAENEDNFNVNRIEEFFNRIAELQWLQRQGVNFKGDAIGDAMKVRFDYLALMALKAIVFNEMKDESEQQIVDGEAEVAKLKSEIAKENQGIVDNKAKLEQIERDLKAAEERQADLIRRVEALEKALAAKQAAEVKQAVPSVPVVDEPVKIDPKVDYVAIIRQLNEELTAKEKEAAALEGQTGDAQRLEVLKAEISNLEARVAELERLLGSAEVAPAAPVVSISTTPVSDVKADKPADAKPAADAAVKKDPSALELAQAKLDAANVKLEAAKKAFQQAPAGSKNLVALAEAQNDAQDEYVQAQEEVNRLKAEAPAADKPADKSPEQLAREEAIDQIVALLAKGQNPYILVDQKNDVGIVAEAIEKSGIKSVNAFIKKYGANRQHSLWNQIVLNLPESEAQAEAIAADKKDDRPTASVAPQTPVAKESSWKKWALAGVAVLLAWLAWENRSKLFNQPEEAKDASPLMVTNAVLSEPLESFPNLGKGTNIEINLGGTGYAKGFIDSVTRGTNGEIIVEIGLNTFRLFSFTNGVWNGVLVPAQPAPTGNPTNAPAADLSPNQLPAVGYTLELPANPTFNPDVANVLGSFSPFAPTPLIVSNAPTPSSASIQAAVTGVGPTVVSGNPTSGNIVLENVPAGGILVQGEPVVGIDLTNAAPAIVVTSPTNILSRALSALEEARKDVGVSQRANQQAISNLESLALELPASQGSISDGIFKAVREMKALNTNAPSVWPNRFDSGNRAGAQVLGVNAEQTRLLASAKSALNEIIVSLEQQGVKSELSTPGFFKKYIVQPTAGAAKWTRNQFVNAGKFVAKPFTSLKHQVTDTENVGDEVKKNIVENILIVGSLELSPGDDVQLADGMGMYNTHVWHADGDWYITYSTKKTSWGRVFTPNDKQEVGPLTNDELIAYFDGAKVIEDDGFVGSTPVTGNRGQTLNIQPGTTNAPVAVNNGGNWITRSAAWTYKKVVNPFSPGNQSPKPFTLDNGFIVKPEMDIQAGNNMFYNAKVYPQKDGTYTVTYSDRKSNLGQFLTKEEHVANLSLMEVKAMFDGAVEIGKTTAQPSTVAPATSGGRQAPYLSPRAQQMQDDRGTPMADKATIAPTGGIDFDSKYLQMNLEGSGIDMPVPQGFEWLLREPIEGFIPKILDIKSGVGFNLPFFAGVVDPTNVPFQSADASDDNSYLAFVGREWIIVKDEQLV